MDSESLSRVAIIGQGYVGLPLALAAAKSGWSVCGIDTSSEVVGALQAGQSHIEDVPSIELKDLIRKGRYFATDDFGEIRQAEICVLCVPTPLDNQSSPDLSYLGRALEEMAPNLNDKTLIINESTSYPGTLREIIKPRVLELLPKDIATVYFAAAPERIDPGNKRWNLKSTPRLISGVDEISTYLALDFYKSFCDEVVQVSSPEVAEMAKLLENTFRQVNIALINQLVPVSYSMGIELREVIEAAGTKPYGFMKFYPGAGVGGHCIPIDPLYLLWKARELGIDLPFIRSADNTNKSMSSYVCDRAIALAEMRHIERVLLLGVAYKSGVSDIRETPAKGLSDAFLKRGMRVLWFDPLVEDFEYAEKWQGDWDVDCAIVVTAQAGLPVQELVEAKVPVLDCTGMYSGVEGVSQL